VLEIDLSVVDGEIAPAPTEEVRELLALLGAIHACQVMRAQTANAFSFASGDKRVDKTKQAGQWAELEASLRAEYRDRLRQVRPEVAQEGDDAILTPHGLGAVIYESGSAL
jgi:hypothetical protein